MRAEESTVRGERLVLAATRVRRRERRGRGEEDREVGCVGVMGEKEEG
jgi:hypothetical protein